MRQRLSANRAISTPQAVASVLLMLALGGLSGCRGDDGQLPPVFGAVFGLSGAATTPYTVGKIAEPTVDADDTLVGGAANSPGLCIWRDGSGQRFRAECPQGYSP